MKSSIKSRGRLLRLVFHATGVLVATAAAASCHSSSSAGLSASCTLNSDCDSPLECVFSRCHNACVTAADCPMGERCVPSGTPGLNVCQLPVEQSCSGTTCETGQVCVTSDDQCRESCSGPDAGPGACVSGGACETVGGVSACFELDVPSDESVLVAAGLVAPDGAVLDAAAFNETADGSPVSTPANGAGDGSSTDGSSVRGTSDGASVDATLTDGAAGADGPTVVSCAVAQTQFGNTAQGDSNPNFTSGVGVRTAASLLIFSGYAGPAADAGAGTDAGTVNLVYVQAFDPTTANSLGPAQPLFAAPAGVGFVLESAAVAPTGQIAIAFNYGSGTTSGVYDYGDGDASQEGLYAAFLAPSPDAGPAGLTLVRTVQIESAEITGQPHVAWSVPIGAFTFSWEYLSVDWFIDVSNFLPGGQPAGGGIAVVPTDHTGVDDVVNSGYNQEQGSVAAGPTLFGVAFESAINSKAPLLTILDSSGNQVGSPVLATGGVGTGSETWVTVGATATGFVYVYDDGNAVAETFLPTSGDAGVVESDAGLAGFAFAGAIHALDGHAVNDDVGGPGGVGVALLYSNGLSFGYVNADGVTHDGPTSVISHTYAAGDQININNVGGSFGLSIYSSATQSTQIAASGCVTQ